MINSITLEQNNDIGDGANRRALNTDKNMNDDKTMDKINKNVLGAIDGDKGQAISMGLIDEHGNALDGKNQEKIVVSEGNTNNVGRQPAKNKENEEH